MPDDERTKCLGEALYPRVAASLGPQHAAIAGRVTGMLLEMDAGDILELAFCPPPYLGEIVQTGGYVPGLLLA